MPQTPAAGAVSAVEPDPTGRIETLDILRGFALLGMIIVHFHQKFRLSTPWLTRSTGEQTMTSIIWSGIEQKARIGLAAGVPARVDA